MWLAVGSALLIFMGWQWNGPFAMWLAPVFLMRFFRTQERWSATLIAIPAMGLGLFVNLTGSWDFGPIAKIGITLVRMLPMLAALYADRAATRRLRAGWATLVYPATYVVCDYLIGLTLLGTVFSPAITQFEVPMLIQLASVTGLWGITFVMGAFASVMNLAWGHDFDLRQAGTPLVVFGACISVILLAGSLRHSLEPPAQTARVAGITVAHTRDYWAEIIDVGTPQDVAHRYRDELAELEDQLFAESARAAQFGAQIVFWAEADAMLYPEEFEAFMARAQAFATEHQVYFEPAYAVFRYDETTIDNQLAMITPAGEIAYTYTKTKSWSPTDSDGVLHSVDTPYGRLSSVICFDLDFPALLRQASKQGVDIMLVPSFDWEPIKPYHTHVGLFRALENGMSVIRHVNEGTSIAVDYQGRLLAYQDFFNTTDPVMLADVPTQGVRTVYGLLGDWVIYASLAFLVVVGVRIAKKS
jgi:apolipoprotein N-acyltransferase